MKKDFVDPYEIESRNRYKKILFLGFCESTLWICFILMTIFAFILSDFELFLEGILFTLPALSIDYFVLKKYRNTEEFYQLRRDVIAFLSKFKPK